MIREFTLINSLNESWTFTEKTFKVFLNNPQGLGFTRTATTVRYGNRQNLTDITDNFPQPGGDILFYDSANGDRYTDSSPTNLLNSFTRCRTSASSLWTALSLLSLKPRANQTMFLPVLWSSRGFPSGRERKSNRSERHRPILSRILATIPSVSKSR